MSLNDERGQDNPPLEEQGPGAEITEKVKGFAIAIDRYAKLFHRLGWNGFIALNLVLASIVLWTVIVPSYFRQSCTIYSTHENSASVTRP